MQWKIPLFKSYWEEDDIDSISNVIRRGTYWAAGPEIERFEEILNRLGKFRTGKSCLYINKLEDIDTSTLKELMEESIKHLKKVYQ